MEFLGKLIGMIFEFLKRDITIWDYTFSIWGVMIVCAVAGILGWFIWSFLE